MCVCVCVCVGVCVHTGSPEEDEEEAQLRGERTASLVAHAALDTHGDIDITTHTSNTTGNGTSTPASLMLPSDSTKGVMGTNGHAKGVGSAMGQGGPGAGAAGGSASRVSVGGQATPTGGPSSRVASRGATPPALQRPLGVAEAPLGMEDTAADMNNTDGTQHTHTHVHTRVHCLTSCATQHQSSASFASITGTHMVSAGPMQLVACMLDSHAVSAAVSHVDTASHARCMWYWVG